ncbi:DUF167 domain-containing protein [Hansschlegelia quercus]|uniref:UPF0235 protein EYR15_08140 n=1 Tax=Hansschlegelia quercus TaxID=2528245 RepID=A0A4Q9GPE7_9HYPH|nr:DUF167 family protein [Hansschlegelia quercus]TBN53760.1 DUF167 domain-containing protein [Hansschlegelia quercus]
MDEPKPYSIETGTLRLRVRVTPRARMDALGGLHRDGDGRTALQAKLAAAPVDGAANAALIALVSKTLKLRKADVVIASGETSRSKTLRLDGDPHDLAARVETLIAAQP